MQPRPTLLAMTVLYLLAAGTSGSRRCPEKGTAACSHSRTGPKGGRAGPRVPGDGRGEMAEGAHCATCHHGTMTVWALSEAKSQGYAVAAETLADVTKWTKERLESIDKPRDTRPGWSMVNTPAVYLAVMAQAVPKQDAVSPGRAAADRRPSPAAPGDRRLLGLVVGTGQEPAAAALRVGRGRDADGLPGPGAARPARPEGEVRGPRRPREGGRLAGEDQAHRDHAGHGTAAVPRRPGGQVAEGTRAGDRSAPEPAERGRRLGPGKDLPSDAYATGQALYFLSLAGVQRDREEIRRGVTFLVADQKEDGSWPMTSRCAPGATAHDQPGAHHLLRQRLGDPRPDASVPK